jgi:hypothetical protein
MKINIEVNHQIGDIVYLRTDPEQQARIITAYMVTPREVMYEVACGVMTTPHYEFELSTEKDVSLL